MRRLTLANDVFLWVAIPAYFADRLTKGLALDFLARGMPDLEGTGLGLRLRLNPGGFFFLPDVAEWKWPALLLVSVVLYALLFVIRLRWARLAVPAALILGGALGNLHDYRIAGAGVDFLHVAFGKTGTVTLNLADLFVLLGVLWMDLVWLRSRARGSGSFAPAAPLPSDSAPGRETAR